MHERRYRCAIDGGDEGRNQGATVAGEQEPACSRAPTRLCSCTILEPAKQERAPNMNNVLVTIAPAMEALTRVYCPARSAASRDDEFRQVSERAIQEPARRCRRCLATDSVA